jgi:UDPglucose 6-dehydrogenase
MNNIAVIGTGYVGLVTGACLSEFGFNVVCLDKDSGKINCLKNGNIPIYEPELDKLVSENYRRNRLHFTCDYSEAVQNAATIFIAVGTPPQEDGGADLSYVLSAAKEIARHINGYTVIVNKSTVPVGTAGLVRKTIREELDKMRKDFSFDVISNPEFLREGSAVYDFMHPDRIVIGFDSEKAKEIMQKIYEPVYLNNHPFVFCSNETAEMIKYASNAFLAVKISFINDVARLCDKADANVQQVAAAMGLDGRIGKKFLHAGPGYGGSCFPKDTRALSKIGDDFGVDMLVVKSAVQSNEIQKKYVVQKIIAQMDSSVDGKTITVLGLAFKPNTDDVREAPSQTIIRELYGAGAKIRAYDPEAAENAGKYSFSDLAVYYAPDEYDAVRGADAVVILTEWNIFRKMDLESLLKNMKGRYFFDMRNIYERNEVEQAGFIYTGMGK